MDFKYFIKKRQARKSLVDKNLAKSLLEQTKKDMEFFKNLEVNELSSRKLVSNYYDFLRTILEAVASLDGYKIYGHEAFTYYLIEKGENEISRRFERFRFIRNGINYYGRKISVGETKEIIEEIKKIVSYLIKRYFK